MRHAFGLFLTGFLLALPPLAPSALGQDYKLTLLHTNDVHSRLQPINRFASTCTAKEEADKQCFGGVARISWKAREQWGLARAEGREVLFVDGGDQFQGSLFYTHYRGKEVALLMPLMGYHAMAVGNHEFDNGPGVLAEFIKAMPSIPVLSANTDASRDNALAGLIRTHAIFERGGRRIAVLGYTTEDTAIVANPGPAVVFQRIEDALIPLVSRLRAEGVHHVVALSHSGLSRDIEVARAVEGIDVIIGGHSHTLLGNGHPNAAGPYPVVAKSPSGRNVPIVQAAAYSQYLGRLDLTFDAGGRLTGWAGNTLLLDHQVPEDPLIKAQVEILAKPLEAVKSKVVGRLGAPLGGDREGCRRSECTMGNFVADAILWKMKPQGAEIALQNGGGLRAGLNAGEVTMGDVLTVLPFQNAIATLILTGEDLLAALESGVSEVEKNAGRFPQVSGMRYAFSRTKPPGERIISVEIRTAEGDYAPLDMIRMYTVATNDFMRRGGDGYAVLRDRAISAYDFGPGLEDTAIEYLAHLGEARVERDGRIEAVD
jgi:5'-nucleotidase